MSIIRHSILIIIVLAALNTYSQNIINIVEENQNLKNAWAGGMNSMQFGEIDINIDGIMDLIALDRDGVYNVIATNYEGNRLMPFINKGIANEINYEYSPEFTELFPQLYNWAVFRDYNGDGKTDIFTYSPGWGGILVYKNISTSSLKFELVVSPFLESFQGGGYTNIFVTYVDYPGIYDIDGDGDLDILSFSALGSFVDMHTNLSMETYGNADSLIYERTSTCWGYFAESEESNKLYLDTCNQNRLDDKKDGERHTGSTFLLLDLDADDDVDLLLSDIDYPNLIALENGGSRDEAIMVSYDTLFPGESEAIELFSMPVASYTDVNNDGLKDLIVSTFDPSIIKSENKNSVYLYLNKGQNNAPVFELETKNFLQSDILDLGSAAYPKLFDFDNDGLLDLIIGNFGYYQSSYYDEANFLHSKYRSRIDFYKNTGTNNNPKFQLWKKDLGNIWNKNLLGAVPAMEDLNGDGKTDMLIGNEDGNLIFSQQTTENNFEIIDDNYLGIDVGEYSYPQLFDLDNDGLKDLIIGEKDGNINYYQNSGSSGFPQFQLITDSLGKINVTDYNFSYSGYSSPYFFRLEDGSTNLVVGSEQGILLYYENIDNNLQGKFTLSNNLHLLLDTTDISLDRGLRTAAALADLNNDGIVEMIAGNYSGGLEYFGNKPELLPGFMDHINKNNFIKVYPNPTKANIDILAINDIQIIGYKLYSTDGKLLVVKEIDSINVSSPITFEMPPEKGIYYLVVQTKKHRISKKIVVIE